MLQHIILLSALVLGSITDLKRREVPDTLNYSLIIIGLLMNGAYSLMYLDYSFILNSVIGFGIGFLIGALFYYTGQWGGGDAKLIMGIGAVIGVNIFNLNSIPFFILFIISSLLIGAIYGISWLVVLAIKNKNRFIEEYKKLSSTKYDKILKIVIIILFVFLLALLFFNIERSLIIPSYIFLFLLTLAVYSKNFFKAIENSVLIKTIKINELTEGDWVLDEYEFKNKIIKANKTGISEEEIKLLKNNNVKNVKIRQGIPFVPSFLISYIVLLIVGNWLLIF